MSIYSQLENLQTRANVLFSYVNGPVAQRLEQGTHNPLVPGSNPGGPSSLTSLLDWKHRQIKGR